MNHGLTDKGLTDNLPRPRAPPPPLVTHARRSAFGPVVLPGRLWVDASICSVAACGKAGVNAWRCGDGGSSVRPAPSVLNSVETRRYPKALTVASVAV
eukprot:541760-Pleurochrysis_carterae.AAC.1